ncbi:MAG TPA: hypothetical protein VKY27_08340 [Bacteriovoracaceae bacterium]|nr:hypothetical protein [Bacteriovoracaceae bacterium]
MKLLLTALIILPFSLGAQGVTEYMRNDGTAAPESIDQAVEEGRIQREEAEEEEIQREEEDEVLEREDFGLPETTDPIEMQKEEAERVEDNYLIGLYNGKGEYELPKEKEEAIKGGEEPVQE